jgi:hypothetical protein
MPDSELLRLGLARATRACKSPQALAGLPLQRRGRRHWLCHFDWQVWKNDNTISRPWPCKQPVADSERPGCQPSKHLKITVSKETVNLKFELIPCHQQVFHNAQSRSTDPNAFSWCHCKLIWHSCTTWWFFSIDILFGKIHCPIAIVVAYWFAQKGWDDRQTILNLFLSPCDDHSQTHCFVSHDGSCSADASPVILLVARLQGDMQRR